MSGCPDQYLGFGPNDCPYRVRHHNRSTYSLLNNTFIETTQTPSSLSVPLLSRQELQSNYGSTVVLSPGGRKLLSLEESSHLANRSVALSLSL
jgi:hypothetical protein